MQYYTVLKKLGKETFDAIIFLLMCWVLLKNSFCNSKHINIYFLSNLISNIILFICFLLAKREDLDFCTFFVSILGDYRQFAILLHRTIERLMQGTNINFIHENSHRISVYFVKSLTIQNLGIWYSIILMQKHLNNFECRMKNNFKIDSM